MLLDRAALGARPPIDSVLAGAAPTQARSATRPRPTARRSRSGPASTHRIAPGDRRARRAAHALVADAAATLDRGRPRAGRTRSRVWQKTRDLGRRALPASSTARCASSPGASRPSALHVHVGVPDPEAAIRAINRLRAHLPLLLALSANSPSGGRDTGLASARTPLFQAFPRVGIPRAFADYADYVEAIDLLMRCDAFPEPTFLWWDVRLQPRFGTVEVRIMDAQTTVADYAAIAALVQCLVRLEVERRNRQDRLIEPPEVLAENRFLAARDGVEGRA